MGPHTHTIVFKFMSYIFFAFIFAYDMNIFESLYFSCSKLLVNASAANISANMNSIHVLNDTNFKSWKENVLLVLGCMDLDFAIRKEQPASLTVESSTTEKLNFEKWERSNRLSLMMIKRSIPEAFRGGKCLMTLDEVSVNDFLDELEKRFAKNEKAETSKLLADLVQMRYKAKGNIREYIMEMSNIVSKT